MSTPTKSTPVRRAEVILLDARTLRALIQPALEALDVGMAGWPASTPGANPDTPPAPTVMADIDDGPGARQQSTATERAALDRDPARTDLDAMLKHLSAAETATRAAAIIAARWATPTMPKAHVEQRIAEIDIWCTNHLRHQMREPRTEGATVCHYCASFQADYKRHAPVEVLDYRARYGRINAMQITRILQQIKDREKAAKRAGKRGAA